MVDLCDYNSSPCTSYRRAKKSSPESSSRSGDGTA